MRPVDIKTSDGITGQNNAIETVGFKFDQNNAYFFRSMIDGLYADKVSSVVREIVANAIDAHAMAKVKPTRPVEVNLPTLFAQTFSVRDFGDGMDHEFVMELYTTLGHSSKTRTNVATGMFGLGAKTPFAISDSFEVRVYSDGTERQYRCYYNNKNCPELALAQTIPTTEPNGVKVIVPVTDRDKQSQFEHAVDKAALCYFDKSVKFNRPTASGDNIVSVTANKITKYGTCFYTRRANHSTSTRSGYISVRQGFAVYPLELSKLKGDFSDFLDTTDDILSSVVDQYNGEIMIDCPIGTFEVTPSRELIQYTPATIANLSKLVGEEFERVRAELYALIGDSKTVFEAAGKLLAKGDDPKAYGTFASNALRGRVSHYNKRIVENFVAAMAKDGIKVTWYSKNSAYGSSLGFEPVMPSNYTVGTAFRPGAHARAQLTRKTLDLLGVAGGFMYTATTSNNDDHCATTKTSDLTIYPEHAVLVMPTDLRNWEDRVHHFIRTKSVFDVNKNSIASAVIRVPRLDVERVGAYIAAHNTSVQLVTDDTLFVEPPKTIALKTNRVSRPRPAMNDAHVMSTSGSWTECKNVDFNEPCYLVVRDKRHGNIGVADAATIATFDALKIGASTKFSGLKLRGDTTEYSLGRLVKAMRELGVLDTSTPIYSLNRSQHERLVKSGVTPTLLMDHLIASLSPLFAQFKSDMQLVALLKQDVSATANRIASVINSTAACPELKTLTATLLSDRLVRVHYAFSQLSSTSFSSTPFIPKAAIDMAIRARNATGRYDDAFALLTTNYHEMVVDYAVATPVPHCNVSTYMLVPEQYNLRSSAQLRKETEEYLKYAVAANAIKHDAMATDLLAALPSQIQSVVVDIMAGALKHFNPPVVKQLPPSLYKIA